MPFSRSDLPGFEYEQPARLENALALLSSNPGATCFLGGTDLWPRMRRQEISPSLMIDLKKITDFPPTHRDQHGALHLSAPLCIAEVFPWLEQQSGMAVLSQALSVLGTPSLRNRATLAGNVCNASPAADSAAPLLVLGAQLHLQSVRGSRLIPLENFFVAPRRTVCQADELLLEVILPAQLPPSRGMYLKRSRNRAADLAICGVALQVTAEASAASGFCAKVAVNGAHATPRLLTEVTDFLHALPWNSTTFIEAAELAATLVQPIDDLRASAAYRQAMVRELTLQALHTLHQQLREDGVACRR